MFVYLSNKFLHHLMLQDHEFGEMINKVNCELMRCKDDLRVWNAGERAFCSCKGFCSVGTKALER